MLATAAGTADAIASIGRALPDLILVSRDLGGADGLQLLCELRSRHPQIERVLVMERGSGAQVRRAIAEADLAFVVRRPWHPESLRQSVRDVLAGGRRPRGSWTVIPTEAGLVPPPRPRPFGRLHGSTRHIDSLSRALLTRLNSCEHETEILRLLHVELAPVCRLRRWLWIGEKPFRSIRIAGRPPARVEVASTRLDAQEWNELQRLRCHLEGGPLGRPDSAVSVLGESVLGITLFLGSHGRLFGLTWADEDDLHEIERLIPLLRELRPGLQNALARVREAETRDLEARELARRVSDDLRGPAGALVHAVDRLRREAQRSGMPSVWLEQVSAESRRVAEAVAHLENELIAEPVHRVAS